MGISVRMMTLRAGAEAQQQGQYQDHKVNLYLNQTTQTGLNPVSYQCEHVGDANCHW
jgi:hypothetical protein